MSGAALTRPKTMSEQLFLDKYQLLGIQSQCVNISNFINKFLIFKWISTRLRSPLPYLPNQLTEYLNSNLQALS